MDQQTPLRYKPPQQVNLRNLVVAAGAATVGSLEIVAAAGLGLPAFVLQAGLLLVGVAVVIGGWSFLGYRARQWTVTTDGVGVRVLRRKKSTVHPWPTLNAAHLRSDRLELWGTSGRRVERLRLGGRHAGDGPESVANAIQDRIDRAR